MYSLEHSVQPMPGTAIAVVASCIDHSSLVVTGTGRDEVQHRMESHVIVKTDQQLEHLRDHHIVAKEVVRIAVVEHKNLDLELEHLDKVEVLRHCTKASHNHRQQLYLNSVKVMDYTSASS